MIPCRRRILFVVHRGDRQQNRQDHARWYDHRVLATDTQLYLPWQNSRWDKAPESERARWRARSRRCLPRSVTLRECPLAAIRQSTESDRRPSASVCSCRNVGKTSMVRNVETGGEACRGMSGRSSCGCYVNQPGIGRRIQAASSEAPGTSGIRTPAISLPCVESWRSDRQRDRRRSGLRNSRAAVGE